MNEISSGDSPTPIPLKQIDFDTAESLDMNTTTFTAPVRGIYELAGCGSLKLKSKDGVALVLLRLDPVVSKRDVRTFCCLGL